MIQHSLMMFQESLHSEYTRKKYTYFLKLFRDYYSIKDFDGIISIDQKEIQKMVETYVIHIKKKLNPNTIPTYMNPVKAFLEINDIDLNWRKIKRLYPAKIKRSGSSAYQTEEIERMLDVTPQLRNKALIHFFASSGVRVGALQDLRLAHLRDMELGCKMVLVYEDSTEEYRTYLTPEASKALELYFEERRKDKEILNDESPVFRERYQIGTASPKALSTEAIQGVIARTMKNAAIRGQKKNGRYSEQLVHGFRKRFNIILKTQDNVNSNFAEKLMGHSVTIQLDGVYLPSEDSRVIDKCFNEFKKVIMELTIDPTERQKIKIESLEAEKTELEEAKKQVERWEMAYAKERRNRDLNYTKKEVDELIRQLKEQK